MGRRRIEAESNESTMVGVRLGASTIVALDALAAQLPSPFGPPTRTDVARAAILAGVRVLARQSGIQIAGLTDEPKPRRSSTPPPPRAKSPKNGAKKSAAKNVKRAAAS